jgi:uncharacterized coiled-coil protein SlyX
MAYQESNHDENGWAGARADANRWLMIAVAVLVVITVVTFIYGYHQQSVVQQLTAQAATANAAMNQMQGQLNAVNEKLSEMTAAQSSPQATASSTGVSVVPPAEPSGEISAKALEAVPTPASSPKAAPLKRSSTRHRAPVDKKYAQLQAQLTEQEKQLKETQDQVAKNRSDLEGTISSTRDDLNGSIAKTHEELVVLEKRGERSYFEFDLSKSKQFQRIGPLTLSLRKADTKHKSYDLAMVVDDSELQKKKVNLYEPIWIHTESDSQPVQIIVNRIDKDTVHGYISAPKYKPSELAAGSANVSPVSTKPPADTSKPQEPR